MEKRIEKIFLISFAVFAVGLGFWGYARVGSGYTAGGAWQPVHPLTALEAVRCLISSIGLLRLYDLFQPGKDPWQLIVAQIQMDAPPVVDDVVGKLGIGNAHFAQHALHSVIRTCGDGDQGDVTLRMG